MNIVKAGLAAVRLVKKASPILLSAGAGIGMVLTYVLAIRETEKAQEVIQEMEEEQEETGQPVKMAKKLVKIYAPSFILLVVTLLCIVQSTIISQHRIRDLTASYSALAAFIHEYRHENIEVNGEDADIEVLRKLVKNKRLYNPPPSEEDRILCYMPTYPNWFSIPSTEQFKDAILKVNEHIDTHGYAELSQLFKWADAIEYDEFGNRTGMDPAYLGHGWEELDLCATYGISGLYPEFHDFMDDSGLEAVIIDIPEPRFLEVLI